jgi:hypothetical protein
MWDSDSDLPTGKDVNRSCYEKRCNAREIGRRKQELHKGIFEKAFEQTDVEEKSIPSVDASSSSDGDDDFFKLHISPISLPIEFTKRGKISKNKDPKLKICLTLADGNFYEFDERGATIDVPKVMVLGNASPLRATLEVCDCSSSHYLIPRKGHTAYRKISFSKGSASESGVLEIKISKTNHASEGASRKNVRRSIFYADKAVIP